MLSERQRRLGVGILFLISAVVALWLNLIDRGLGARYTMLQASSLRMTPVLAVLWLAFPEMRRGPGGVLFLLAVVCAVALAFAKGKAALKFLIPAIIALFVLGYLRRFTTLLGGGPRR